MIIKYISYSLDIIIKKIKTLRKCIPFYPLYCSLPYINSNPRKNPANRGNLARKICITRFRQVPFSMQLSNLSFAYFQQKAEEGLTHIYTTHM